MSPPLIFRSCPLVIGLVFAGFFTAAGYSSAAEAPKRNEAVDNIIGSSFKTMAKAFVATADLEKLKKHNIEKLKKSDENKFRRQYLKAYNTVKDCPAITAEYGLTPTLEKKAVIEKINSLNKKKIYQAIDSVPNSFIADQFRAYLAKKNEELKKADIGGQIARLWQDMINGAFGKKKEGKAK